MANHKSGAQRYNDRMDKIFSNAKVLNKIHDEGREKHSGMKHSGEYSACKHCHAEGGNIAKQLALHKKMK